MEVYRSTATSTLASLVGDYGTVLSQYFDQAGAVAALRPRGAWSRPRALEGFAGRRFPGV